MEKSDKEKINNYLVDAAAFDTFDFLHGRFMETLPEKEILDFTKCFITGLESWVDFDQPEMESPKELAGLMEIKWDAGMYLFYIDTFDTSEFIESINEPDTILGLMGIVSGIHRSISNFQSLLQMLQDGKELDELYTHRKADVSFIKTNEKDIEHSKMMLYSDLISGYDQMLELQPEKEEFILNNEVKEFERLFESGQSKVDWTYLSKRMLIPIDQIEQIYQDRHGITQGDYLFTQFSFDRDERLNYAILLGVREYISFLCKDQESTVDRKTEEGDISRDDKSDDPYFKLVLKTTGIDSGRLNLNIRKSYDILIEEKIIEGDYKGYKSAFLIDIPLKRNVKWLTERKELKYFVCQLSGKDFSELTSKTSGYVVTSKGSGKSVFISNTSILKKAASSFLSAEGNKIPQRGVEIDNGVTPLSNERKQLLNRIAELFTSL